MGRCGFNGCGPYNNSGFNDCYNNNNFYGGGCNDSDNSSLASTCNDVNGYRKETFYQNEDCYSSKNASQCCNNERDSCNSWNGGCDSNGRNGGYGTYGCDTPCYTPCNVNPCGIGSYGGGCGIGSGSCGINPCGFRRYNKFNYPSSALFRDLGYNVGRRSGFSGC